MKVPAKIMTHAELRATRAANVIARACTPLPRQKHHMRSPAERTKDWRQTERGKAMIKASNDRPKNQEANRDRTRAHAAKRLGIAAPPLERDCPPRPADGRCDCCLVLVLSDNPGRFHLDHDHVTGAFRGWTCNGCNTGARIVDDPDRLRTRADFLINGFRF
jgi:hypothetical protein